MKGLNLKIYGQVQGVFFRANTQEEAQRLGLAGWVKNKVDGSVLIEAQGEKEKLEQLIDWCQKGSPNSQVEKIEIQWRKNTKDYKDSTIKY